MHIYTLVALLAKAFDGELCNSTITTGDRNAVIREFARLYFESQAKEREHKARCMSERMMHHINQDLDEPFGIPIAKVEDFTPDPAFNTRKYPKNN